MTDRVLQQLGNYCLLHLLGRGGFAEVYLAEHRYLKRRAALKVLHASLRDEEVSKFLSEAQTLARLDHPNIMRVHDFAVEQGIPFLAMDHAPGGTLRDQHPHGSCPSLATIVAYVKQIAAALQYAHTHHVIHRDVKPENMLLGPSQQVMLSDFGLALFSPSPEQLSTQVMAGTIPYMAPEQIRGRPTFASDQYALGIVVYEWLCGARPFEGAPWQIAYQQVSTPPPPLRQHNPSLPQAVEDVVLKALAKDPQERHANVELFALALEQAISDLPFEPRNPYKGLRAFTQADAADFFGHDTLSQELLDRVKEASTSNARLLTVIGPSGSGKSSVVMAGLLPRLQRGTLPTSQHWVYLEPMLPGTHPRASLPRQELEEHP
jgi:serine/threonine protein kinase